ncbi:hypothetical protein HY375_03855 [Candidatus Berkelbacteria bacterium]|nr:hypothetical protein [Candidatus Berkelbacteria bacterium]
MTRRSTFLCTLLVLGLVVFAGGALWFHLDRSSQATSAPLTLMGVGIMLVGSGYDRPDESMAQEEVPDAG